MGHNKSKLDSHVVDERQALVWVLQQPDDTPAFWFAAGMFAATKAGEIAVQNQFCDDWIFKAPLLAELAVTVARNDSAGARRILEQLRAAADAGRAVH